MNSFWTSIFVDTVLGDEKKRSKNRNRKLSSYEKAKVYHVFKVSLIELIKDILLICLGIFSAGFGLKSFLLPNRFVDGGATGISLLIAEVTHSPLSIVLILVNLPFLFFGLRLISTTFAMRAALAILGLALVVAVIPYPQITQDKDRKRRRVGKECRSGWSA